MNTTSIIEQERIEFETWHKSKHRGYDYKLLDNGYLHARVDLDFEIWQAARAISQSEPVAEIVEHEYLNGHIKMIKPLSEMPVGTKLYATPQQAIPSGFKLVPIEPTEEMLEQIPLRGTGSSAESIYEAILSASPTAPIESDK